MALVCSDATIDTRPELIYKIVASQLIPPSLYTKIYLYYKITILKTVCNKFYIITYVSFKGSKILIPYVKGVTLGALTT